MTQVHQPARPAVKVLFVCLGNICRSPMAEAVFMQRVQEAGLGDEVAADSAGTGDWHAGSQPHRGTRNVLLREGVPWDHRARVITRSDPDDFDYVVVMDDENLQDVRRLGSGRAQLSRLMDHAPDVGISEVPDPYYSGRFDEVYRLVKLASERLLRTICAEHALSAA